MSGQKMFKVNVFLPFSSLNLPWARTNPDKTQEPLRLEDPPRDSDAMIGFMPVYGTLEAATEFSAGRYAIDEITMAETVAKPKPAYATVNNPEPTAPDVATPPTPDNTITVDPTGNRRRRRR